MSDTPGSEAADAPHYRYLVLDDPPEDRPFVFINMVASMDGRAVIEGNERGLGSPTDQRLMRELRSLADMVVNGAETMRASGSSPRLGDPGLESARVERGQRPVPLAAVLTRSGDLPLERIFFTADDFDAVVYASVGTPDERVQAIEATGRRVFLAPTDGQLPWVLSHMRHELGVRSLLVEGGPTVNGQLIDLALVDEFFLTLAPRVVGGRASLPTVTSERQPTLDAVRNFSLLNVHRNPRTDELYLRYRRKP